VRTASIMYAVAIVLLLLPVDTTDMLTRRIRCLCSGKRSNFHGAVLDQKLAVSLLHLLKRDYPHTNASKYNT